MKARPLFVTGMARSGSTLLARMLDAHDKVRCAADPFMPLFRSLRNAVLSKAEAPGFSPSQPFQDYYFSRSRLAQMQALIDGELDLPCNPDQTEALLASLSSRAAYEAPDLLPGLPSLAGPDYRHWLERGLELIAEVRDGEQAEWIGIKEVWVIDFLPLLARAFPEARFIVLHRDPRAIVNSLLGLAARDPSQAAHVLSYLRHWRKYLAFDLWLAGQRSLEGRLLSLRYEDLLTSPGPSAAAICAFLGLEEPESLLDPGRYRDYVSGGIWQGNSSFAACPDGIAPARAESWRRRLDPAVIELSDFICGADMPLLGYEPISSGLSDAALTRMAADDDQQLSWRSDLGELAADAGAELLRRRLLTAAAPPHVLIESCFLFPQVYQALKGLPADE